MALLTTSSDFISGLLKIPNAVTANAGEADNPDLLKVINETEEDMLLVLLGKAQYDSLETAIADLGNADAYLVSLVNGSGDWRGLAPLVHRFIYCQWLRFIEISVTTTGAGKANVKNHSVTDYNQKYVERWNEMIEMIEELRKYILDTEELEIVSSFPCYNFENQFGI